MDDSSNKPSEADHTAKSDSSSDGNGDDLLEESPVGLGEEIKLFTDRVDGLKTSLTFTMVASQQARNIGVERKSKLFEKYGTLIEEDGENKKYSVPVAHVREVDAAFRNLRHFDVGLDALPKSHLVALVSAFDFLLSRIVRWYFLRVPEALESGEKSLRLAELLEFESIDVAREFFIEREIESLLRDSHTKQFDWLENKLGCPLRKGLDIWQEFVEITERRNLFVHTDGHVSRQYIKVCGAAGYGFEVAPEIGSELGVPPEYFSRSVDVIFQLGVMLAQTIWRRVARDEIQDADNSLIAVIFDLLRREKFERTSTLVDFSAELPRYGDDLTKRLMIVNRAQCHKWLEDEAKCAQILDDIDWTACSNDFGLCVAVLRDEFEKAGDYMKLIGTGGTINQWSYLNWPVFRKFRESDIFTKTYKEVFGVEPVEKVDAESGIEDEENGSKSDAADGTDKAHDVVPS